jgi:tetratricopeptide (TPR) repeat protein
LTRHDLKEQLQHDTFTDNVDLAIDYVASHRRNVTRWAVIALAVLIAVGIGYAIYRHQKTERDQALQAALAVVETPVGPQTDASGKTYTTQQAKDQAAIKAFSGVASKYKGSEQGDAAQYYLGGLQAEQGKYAEAEANFKAVAGSSSQVSALAKVALAELYSGEGKTEQAVNIAEGLIKNPAPLVSKDQATVLLVSVLKNSDPKRAKQVADSLKNPSQRPEVQRAIDQVMQNTQNAK